MLTWKDVINFSVKGNPTPDSRLEKTETESDFLIYVTKN